MNMPDIKITILSNLDLWGGVYQSEALANYGTKALPTDFAILTGARFYSKANNLCNDSENYSMYNINAFNFMGSVGLLSCVGEEGNLAAINVDECCSVRPVLEVKYIDSLFLSKILMKDSIGMAEFLYYPQDAASISLQSELEERYNNDSLNSTNNTITINDLDYDKYTMSFNSASSSPFFPSVYNVFEYDGGFYIRVKANTELYDDFEFELSNGGTYKNGEYIWVEVSPVRWLVDIEHQKLISEKILLYGINYLNYNQDNVNFSDSFLKEYLENYMLKDLKQEYMVVKQEKLENNSVKKKIKKKINSYGFDFDKVSEEDIIKGAIESGVAVFLHGPSSEGKSARVKQIDPTCEIIYLRNASPESLNGKSVYNGETGEMIDVKPTWLRKVEAKCESEPDRLHVVFFDEITNALPSIQGIAFNIVLDREVNGIWKLPENARIVASGNEMEDSLAANQLAEPLFNRFAHVYIKTTTESWLKWASENGIHPAIYTFMAYKKGTVLRSEFNGVKPNADPRKWEMASKMLYATGKPEMIRSLVGEDITREFVAFCKTNVITLDDVIDGNYDELEIRSLNTAERYATAMTLSQVGETNLEKVRNFASKLGGEYRAIFDSLWVHGDEERLEKIAELEQNDYTNQEQEEIVDIVQEDDIKITLLSIDDLSLNMSKIDTLIEIGGHAYMTDFAILTGGDNVKNRLDGISCWCYTRTLTSNGNVHIIDCLGDIDYRFCDNANGTIRPVLLISAAIFSKISASIEEINDFDFVKLNDKRYYSYKQVELGEYPQFAVDFDMYRELEKEYRDGNLVKTGRSFTINKVNSLLAPKESFKPKVYDEYEYYGKKYIRVKANSAHDFPIVILTNEEEFDNGSFVWLEVSPIEWIVDTKSRTLISKYGLLSGIRFAASKEPYINSFEESEMYEFLNKHMIKDILQSCNFDKVKQKRLSK